MAISDWPLVKLADLCRTIEYGYTASSNPAQVGPKFLRITDIVSGHIDWHAVPYCEVSSELLTKYRLSHDDIVIARTGATTGASAHISNPPDAVFASYLIRLTVTHGVDSRFVSYFLKSVQYRDYIHGVLGDKSAQPNANAKTLTQAKLYLPPLPEQHAIAHILGTLDDKIELDRRMNETLEAMAQALFRSWFVDFDPVRAKAEGRKPVGMDTATAALFPDAFVDTMIGKVPAGWRRVRTGDFIHLDKGVSYKGAFLSDTGMPMINLGCFLGRGRFAPNQVKFYTGEFRPAHLVRTGDIVMANTDMTQKREVLGSPAFVPRIPGGGPCLFTHHVYGLRFTPGTEDRRIFLFFALLQPEFRERAEGYATGTTVLALPRDAVSDYEFVMPPQRLLNVLNAHVLPLLALMNSNEQQIYSLSAVRDALLPKLLSGQIRVNDAEQVISAVL